MRCIDYSNPDFYIGKHQKIMMGYSKNSEIISHAASGGFITHFLIYALENNYIDGAYVSKSFIDKGKVQVKSFIATSSEEIMECSSSIYMDFSLLRNHKDILKFDGKVAVVGLPCQLMTLTKLEDSNPKLKSKIKFKIGLFCSGAPKKEMIESILVKNKIDTFKLKKLYFRQGHWRGEARTVYNNGETISFSYKKNQGTYKNSYFDFLTRCNSCQNHFAYDADISCGDVWLSKAKKLDIKHTAIVVRNNEIDVIIDKMISNDKLCIDKLSSSELLKSQKRALIFKFNTAMARKKLGKIFKISNKCKYYPKSKWNHYIAAFFILMNIKLSDNKKIRSVLYKVPNDIMFLYMCFIRALISF